MVPTDVSDFDSEHEARRALAAGDLSHALETLMTAYGNQIFRYCCRTMLDADAAADVLQTTFLQAFEGCQKFDGRSSFRTWLFGIARHRCLDALKARRRRQSRFDELEMVQEPMDPGEGLEEAALSSERRSALQKCLTALEARTREA